MPNGGSSHEMVDADTDILFPPYCNFIRELQNNAKQLRRLMKPRRSQEEAYNGTLVKKKPAAMKNHAAMKKRAAMKKPAAMNKKPAAKKNSTSSTSSRA